VLAQEIVDDMQTVLEQFSVVMEGVKWRPVRRVAVGLLGYL